MKKLSAVVLFGSALLAVATLPAQAAQGQDAQACSTVKMADPGWSDIAVTNGITAFLLESMGYEAQIDSLAVPIIFGGLKNGMVDVFLGNWMPAQQGFYDKFIANGEVVQLAKNLQGTEFTLAVPSYVYEAGVQTFADLNKHAEQFDQKIYGIGAGAPANQSLRTIIEKNEFGLGEWQLVESSEQAMLSEVARSVRRERAIVFLGWTPHPMNEQFEMKYLKGGEAYFGETGSVHTLTRKGYSQACPNVGKLLGNLKFTPQMENAVMAKLVDKQVSTEQAVKGWIKTNPQVLASWLDGVNTLDGGDALSAVKARL